MNKERILYIAEWLENGAIHVDQAGRVWGFEMEEWAGEVAPEGYDDPNPEFPEECGSAMCIGGAAEQFFGLNDDGTRNNYIPAEELLDLGPDLARELFYPWERKWYIDAGSPAMTPKYMAGVLRRLVETGELIGRECGRPDLTFTLDGDTVLLNFGGIFLKVDFSSDQYRLSEDRDLHAHLRMMLLAAYEYGVAVGGESAKARIRKALEAVPVHQEG